jgi:dihydroxy-acid dehydratase
LVRNGDPIVLDMDRRELNLQVDEDELARRQQEWKAPQRLLRGVLAKYARLVGSAADGAVCG